MKKFKKIALKVIGMIGIFIGLAAFSAVDAEVPLWGTALICLTGIVGFFGGGYLIYKSDPEKMMEDVD